MNLENIKNALDGILNDITKNPLSEKYKFVAIAEGYFLDNVIDLSIKKNIIPVFVGSMGGQVNPVPGLNEIDFNTNINFYFPIDFKEDFYELDNILRNIFSGKIVNFGTDLKPDSALCNVSVPNFNAIMDAGLGELKSWTKKTFGFEIDTARIWMDMNITLYLNTVNKLGQYDGFMMGNDVKISSLEFETVEEGKFLIEDEPVIIERANLVNSSPAVQQLFGETHTKGFPANTGLTKQLPLLIKNNNGYRKLLEIIEKDKNMQSIVVYVTESIPFVFDTGVANNLNITTKYFITDYSRKTAIGEILGLNFTLSVAR